MASWTARTVEAPRLQSTVRISSSASVGRGGSDGLAGIYEDCTTKSVVESRKSCGRRELRKSEGSSQEFTAEARRKDTCGVRVGEKKGVAAAGALGLFAGRVSGCFRTLLRGGRQ